MLFVTDVTATMKMHGLSVVEMVLMSTESGAFSNSEEQIEYDTNSD